MNLSSLPWAHNDNNWKITSLNIVIVIIKTINRAKHFVISQMQALLFLYIP